MGFGRFLLYWAAVGLGLACPLTVIASDTFRKLKDAEIRARLAGMEITDGVHWAEHCMRDGASIEPSSTELDLAARNQRAH